MSQWIERMGISEKDEFSLWNECIFIFDSSALLNFYEYSPTTQKNIFEIIFKQLEGRLWIPCHVRDEYLKNRKTTLKKPASQYRDLLDINFKQIKNMFVEIKNKTKTGEKHPFIDQSIFSDLESALENFEQSFTKNVQEKVNGINDYEKNDLILEAFQKTIKVGEDYAYHRLSEIVAEGEFRYKHKIPPGYLDEDTKGKIGFQIYGDLIIWKQIIDFDLKEIETEKIIFYDVGMHPNFILDNSQFIFGGGTSHSLRITDDSFHTKYVISILNSKLMEWVIYDLCPVKMGNARKYGLDYIRKLPLPFIKAAKQQQFISLVDKILLSKKQGKDTGALENEIDLLVYKLYELTFDEVKIIDNNFWLSEEEYEEAKLQ